MLWRIKLDRCIQIFENRKTEETSIFENTKSKKYNLDYCNLDDFKLVFRKLKSIKLSLDGNNYIGQID